MDYVPFHDDNISRLIEFRSTDFRRDTNHSLQMHSSLIRRLSLKKKLEGHIGCVNSIAWNSQGSLLVSGSDDQLLNIWRYSTHKLLHCLKTGHTTNIFGTEFIPETSDELVASGAGDCEVRVFNISHLCGRRADATAVSPYAHFQCHSKRVKKLAVEAGNPNVVWSASEDGTLRQHDFREVCSCPPNRPSDPECRSVLLDLRSGKKRSLSHRPNGTLSLRSCDISVTRPHLILVGGSDAFARLYDRRMLPPLSSSGRRSTSPSCVNYFCPMHLSESTGRSNVHVTHVAFSPNGDEVVISYSGEHVYLFDVNQGVGSGEQYTSGDAARPWSFSPNQNGVRFQTSENPGENCTRSRTAQQIRCRNLLQTADRCLKEERNFHHGIELCNEVLDGHDCSSDPILKHDGLCIRSNLFLKRKWKNDAHMAVRDLKQALKIDCSSYRALYYMSKALVELGKQKEALDFALAAQLLAPSYEVAQRVKTIRKNLAAEETRKSNRILTMPVNTRTVFPGECSSKFSSAASHMQNKKGFYKPEATVDMKQRFVGHCNMDTDIKQASFLGQNGDYIASGSDDGRWFVWEKKTGRVIKMLRGDEAVVNCIQCHPFDSVVATSGVDNTIKIWTPSSSAPSNLSTIPGGLTGQDTAQVLEAMECNQHSLSLSLEPLLPGELLDQQGQPESDGEPFEQTQCTQS